MIDRNKWTGRASEKPHLTPQWPLVGRSEAATSLCSWDTYRKERQAVSVAAQADPIAQGWALGCEAHWMGLEKGSAASGQTACGHAAARSMSDRRCVPPLSRGVATDRVIPR